MVKKNIIKTICYIITSIQQWNNLVIVEWYSDLIIEVFRISNHIGRTRKILQVLKKRMVQNKYSIFFSFYFSKN